MDLKEFTNFIVRRNILFTASVDNFDHATIMATDVILESSTSRPQAERVHVPVQSQSETY